MGPYLESCVGLNRGNLYLFLFLMSLSPGCILGDMTMVVLKRILRCFEISLGLSYLFKSLLVVVQCHDETG